MEFPSQRADEISKPTLDTHVNVFVFIPKGMSAMTDIRPYSLQPSNDLCTLRIGEHFRLQQGFAMGDASRNVMSV